MYHSSRGAPPPRYGGPPPPHFDSRGPPPPSGIDIALGDFDRLLSELRAFPDKNRITTCTMLAGDNIAFAPDVLGVLFTRLDHAPVDFHLPLLYVWDSILFNIGDAFVQCSIPHLEGVFMRSYRQQSEGTRRKMCHVFNKWRERRTFDPRLLDSLQAHMSAHDRAMLVQRQLPATPQYATMVQYPGRGPMAPAHHPMHPHHPGPPAQGRSAHPAVPAHVITDDPSLMSLFEKAGGSPSTASSPQRTQRPPSPPAETGYLAVVNQLYGMSDELISTDGFRFTERSALEAHNDWYSREKGREERCEAGTQSRPWWVTAVEWIELAPVEDAGAKGRGDGRGDGSPRDGTGHAGASDTNGDRQRTGSGSPRTPHHSSSSNRPVTGVPADVDTDGGVVRKCAFCNEELEVVHSPEEDEWVYRDTVRPEPGQPLAGQIVHRYCLAEAAAPSPITPRDPRDDHNPHKRARRDPIL